MKPYRVLLYEDMHQAGKQLLAEKAEKVVIWHESSDLLVITHKSFRQVAKW